jgi:beta-mannosidase
MSVEMLADLLADAEWECTGSEPGRYEDPSELDAVEVWWPAEVPGTAAGALRLAGLTRPRRFDYDAQDWWFRTSVSTPDGTFGLAFDGLATLADVWLDGCHLLRSENMFRRSERRCELSRGVHRIVIRCAALNTALQVRRPRPRWKTSWTRHQSLRWFRTALQGRVGEGNLSADLPAIVGPWRPVTLRSATTTSARDVELQATPEGEGGVIRARFRMSSLAVEPLSAAVLCVGATEAPLTVDSDGEDLVLHGRLTLPTVERWWPHTHGPQVLYEVTARVGDQTVELGRVGFRTVEVDRRGGAFAISVNGQPIFCRGATWFPPDPFRPYSDTAQLHRTLELLRGAHANMVRIPGAGVYEDRRFFEICDELGILVWHECMFAYMDPPQDPSFEHEVEIELRGVFVALSGHPCVAVVCGGQEIEQSAAMNGLSPDRRDVPLVEKLIPSLAEELLPNAVYVTETPTGGDLPFRTDTGVCHYFGVGGYMRSLSDARLSNVRFAAECLGFATPPERVTINRYFGGATAAGHAPAWKETVHCDSGSSSDFDDVRDFYVELVFGVDARQLRREDPERALDLGRAAVSSVVAQVLSEWRRPGSSCAGALVLALRDQVAGGGWGVIDVDGIPKAPWYVMRRILDPVAVLLSDEGLNGLHCHLVNDGAKAFRGSIVVELFARGEVLVDRVEREVEVPGRGALTIGTESLLDGFRDVTYAYRFGRPAHDVVVIRLVDVTGATRSEAVHLPLGESRPREASVGLRAEVVWDQHGRPGLDLSTERFAQWVVIEVPGFVAEDSWFHLAPRQRRILSLLPVGPAPPRGRLRGRVRALNAHGEAPVVLDSNPP